MRAKGIRISVLALVLAALLCVSACCLADDPVRVSSACSPQSVMEGQEVQITIKVYNAGSTDLADKITLFDPDGQSVESYDGLKSEQSVTYTGSWKVTGEQLTKGRVTYYIRYIAGGEEQTRSIPVTVQAQSANPQLTASYTVSPSAARTGQTVTLTYTLSNTGNVELRNIVVSNPVSTEKLSAAALSAGEKITLEDSFVMGDMELSSEPVITYESAEDKSTHTISDLPKRTITVAQEGIEVAVTADNSSGIVAGETAALNIEVKNTGAAAVSGITVTLDDGTEAGSGIDLAAGASWSGTASRLIAGDTEIIASVSGTGSEGEQVTVQSEPLVITPADASKALVLSVHAQARESIIYEEPAVVRFGVVVENVGQTDATNLVITEAGTKVAEIDSLPAGQSRTVVFDLEASMAGQFRFDVTGKDADGNDKTYSTEIVPVAYVEPTPVPTPVPTPTPVPPTPTPSPTPTPTPTIGEVIEQYVDLRILYTAAAVLGILLVALIAGSSISSARRKKRLASAIEEIELHRDTRSYRTAAKQAKKKDAGKKPEDPAKPAKPEKPEKKEPVKEPAKKAEEKKPAEKKPAEKKPAEKKSAEKAPVSSVVPTRELTREVLRTEKEKLRTEKNDEPARERRRTDVQDLTTGETLRVMPVDQRPEFSTQAPVDNSATRIFGKKKVEEALAQEAEKVSPETRRMAPVSEKQAPAAPAAPVKTRQKPMKKKHSLFSGSTDFVDGEPEDDNDGGDGEYFD